MWPRGSWCDSVYRSPAAGGLPSFMRVCVCSCLGTFLCLPVRFPPLSLHLQREGHTFLRCFPTLALGDAQPELISDGAPAPTQEGPPTLALTHTRRHSPSFLPALQCTVLLGNSAPCPTFAPPTPPRDMEVFKEIDWSLIFLLAWSVTLPPTPFSFVLGVHLRAAPRCEERRPKAQTGD